MTDFTIAKRVIRELRYVSLKGTRWKKGKNVSALDSFVRRNYLASAVSFGFFSMVLSLIRYLETPSRLGFAEAEVILFFYLLITNAYNTVFFLSQVKTSSIMEPVLHLPEVSVSRVLMLACLYYYGTATLFVIIPSLVMYTLLFPEFISLIVLVFWTAIYTILGYSLGVLMVYAASMRSGTNGSGRTRMIGGLVRVLGIVIAFVIFELWIYDPNLISPTVFTSPSIASSFIPVLNVAVASLDPLSSHNMVFLPLSAAAYLLITAFLFRRSSGMLEKAYLAGSSQKSSSNRQTGRKMRHGRFDKLIRKDLLILFRSPQNSVLIFLPLMLSLPALIPVILARPDSPLALYYLTLSLPVMSASFYPLVTLISEGKAITLLFSLPIKKAHFLLSKIFVSGLIFLVVALIVVGFAGAYIGENPILIALTAYCILAGYVSASLINFVRVSRKITDQVTLLNLDSFGGSFGIMVTFALTMILVLAPVLSGSLIAYVSFRNFSDNFFILGLDTVLNAHMLVLTTVLAMRGMRHASIAAFS